MTDVRRYRLRVELVEDLHSGTGTGSGDVDALQMRDRLGRPVIRASHLKGVLLADAEELVAHNAARAKDVHALFGQGGGGRGALKLTSLRLEAGCPGQTLLWTASARVPGGRRPADDTLRVVEHVAAGNRFVAELRLPSDDDLEALLRRLVTRLDRLGADRNRGNGLVKSSLDRLEAIQPAALEIKHRTLRLRLRNLGPLCLPDTGHPGNLIASHSFIRGQVLRGALMRWALARQDTAALDALSLASVGDALPLPGELDHTSPDDIEVMPIPLSLLTPKPAGGSVELPWWARSGPDGPACDALGPCQPPADEKPKRPGMHEYLARRKGGAWLRYSPAMRVHMRQQSTDRAGLPGRPTTEPKLYSMEEIAEDTRFLAELRFESDEAAQSFAHRYLPVLGGGDWLTIGREGRPAVVEKVLGVGLPAATRYGDDWTLTLTADAVVRGPFLGHLDNLDIPVLAELAGIEPDARWRICGHAEIQPLHGFNAASGLRRAAAVAIRRGSCWRIRGENSHRLAEALARLPALGERTDEGCGRFVLDAQPICGLKRATGEPPSARENRQEALLAAACGIAKQRGVAAPSPSQLQWLRNRALAAADEGQLEALIREIQYAPERRPLGGKVWRDFPVEALKERLDGLATLEEKRLLIAHVVQQVMLMNEEHRA